MSRQPSHFAPYKYPIVLPGKHLYQSAKIYYLEARQLAHRQPLHTKDTLNKADTMAYRPPGLTPSTFAPPEDPRSFSRFFDLPPELRIEIYKLYLSDEGLVLGRDTQPALIRSSRQLRQETLPLFENQSVFAADMLVWPHGFQTQPTVRARDLLTDMARKRLSSFRYLKFTITVNAVPRRQFCITVDLSKPGDKSRAIMIEGPRHARKDDYIYRIIIEGVLFLMLDNVKPQEDGWLGCMDVTCETEAMLGVMFGSQGVWSLRSSRRIGIGH